MTLRHNKQPALHGELAVCTSLLRPLPPLPPAATRATRVGPWQAGDGLWPVSEELLRDIIDKRSCQGGMRPIAEGHRQWQSSALVLTGSKATAAQKIKWQRSTCCHCHPGKCAGANAKKGIARVAEIDCQGPALHQAGPGLGPGLLNH